MTRVAVKKNKKAEKNKKKKHNKNREVCWLRQADLDKKHNKNRKVFRRSQQTFIMNVSGDGNGLKSFAVVYIVYGFMYSLYNQEFSL